MTKIQELFNDLYLQSVRRRDKYIADGRFKPWFKHKADSAFPPIVGFGLPRRDDEQVPLVTIATNPSTVEFTGGHILNDDGPDVQWDEQTEYFQQRGPRGPYRRWFDFSNDLVTGVRPDDEPIWSHYEINGDGGLAAADTRSSQRVPHLDLTPVVTDGGMDTVDSEVADRDAGPELLHDGIRLSLLPLLEHLVRHHGTRVAVLYGYLPESSGGGLLERSLRGLLERSGSVATLGGAVGPQIRLAKANFDPNHPFVRERRLSALRVVCCSHSPSYLNSPRVSGTLPSRGSPATKYSDSMTHAGWQIRDWFGHALRSPAARS